jgi:acetyl esterase
MRLPASIALAFLVSSVLSAAVLDKQDVEYGKPGGVSLLLDLHIPDGPGTFPTAILVHGGGFDQGSKSINVRPLFAPLSDAGFAWFSIDYRLAPKFHFQEAMDDVFTAIRWVKAHASEYHVDTRRIALIGESAGGYLVNYGGTHLKADTKVAAVVDFYGPSDYSALALLRREHPERFNMAGIRRHAANGGGVHFFGVNLLDEAAVAKLRSLAPIAGVHSGMPPFLCIHGTADDQVNFEQTSAFCSAIKAKGSNCEIIKIEGGGHGMNIWNEPGMQHWKPEMIEWLRKTFAGQS